MPIIYGTLESAMKQNPSIYIRCFYDDSALMKERKENNKAKRYPLHLQAKQGIYAAQIVNEDGVLIHVGLSNVKDAYELAVLFAHRGGSEHFVPRPYKNSGPTQDAIESTLLGRKQLWIRYADKGFHAGIVSDAILSRYAQSEHLADIYEKIRQDAGEPTDIPSYAGYLFQKFM